MTRRPIRLVAWAVLSLAASAAIFGVLAALPALTLPPGSPGAGASLGSLALYAIAHWLLLGALTLPFLIAPIASWPWVVRVVPSVERSSSSLIAVLAVLSAMAVLGRALLLEYPVLRNQPLALFQPIYLAEWAALGSGLVAPRLAVPFLKVGVFASGAG